MVITSGPAALDARFPGQWFQLEAGLHYNWHRHYDPTTGRYTQPDPLGFVDGPGVYGYECNGQTNAHDKPYRISLPSWAGGDLELDNPFSGSGKPSDDSFSPQQCKPLQPDNPCFEECLLKAMRCKRPPYNFVSAFGGSSCKKWVRKNVRKCRKNFRKDPCYSKLCVSGTFASLRI